MRSTRQEAPEPVASIEGKNKMTLGCFAWDIAQSSPTHDLTYGTLMHLKKFFDVYLIVRSPHKAAEVGARNGKYHYDNTYPPVQELVNTFKEHIVYITPGMTQKQFTNRIKSLKLNVSLHVNGYNEGNFLEELAMADVQGEPLAEMKVEWLSMASMLHDRRHAHYTVAHSDVLTRTQRCTEGREAILEVFPYAVQEWYIERVLAMGEPELAQGPPVLIFVGGNSRVTDELLHVVLDIMRRVCEALGGDPEQCPRFLVQETTTSQFVELRTRARRYCEQNGWPAFWRRITTYPCFYIKLDLYVYLRAFFGRLFAIVASPVHPHTGSGDALQCSIPIGCLTLPGDEWPALVVQGMNKRVGLDMLNFERREVFTAGVSSILLDTALLRAMTKHLWQQMKDGVGFYQRNFHAKVFQAVFPELLERVRASEGGRIKLKDFKPDLKRIEVQCIDFRLNFLRCGPAESSEMEINRIMANIAARGTPIGMCREGVERALRGHQPYMTFVEVCRCAAEGLDV